MKIKPIYIIIIILSFTLFMAAQFSSKDFLSKFQVLFNVMKLVNSQYVEDIDTDKLIDGSIRGLLETLDPHSSYITEDEFKKVEENMQGEFEGIGIEFSILDGYVTVISPIIGTPSDRAGLQSGDQIIKINGKSAYKLKQDEILNKLRGPKGTPVDVTIKRFGAENFDVTLIRDKIPINSVIASFLYNDNTGYIAVNRFMDKTYKEISSSIDSLESIGMNQLVLDLRNNGGGLMDKALQLLDLFVNSQDTLLFTKGRIPNANKVYFATKRYTDKQFPIIVLINRASASASEIIAGGLQDLDRGIVIGETSFGKGLVQRQYMLENGAAARITVAKYYTPSGRLIQRPFDAIDEYYMDLEKENREHSDSLDNNKPEFKTKKGRTVYGGGGITPDIFVESNFSLTKDSQKLLFSPARYLFKYATEIKDQYNQFANFEQFNTAVLNSELKSKKFFVWLKQLIKNDDEYSLTYSEDSLLLNWTIINNRIQSELSSQLWGKDYLYYNRLKIDSQFQSALENFDQARALIE